MSLVYIESKSTTWELRVQMKILPTCFHSGQMNEIWRGDRGYCATCFHQFLKKLTAAHTHTQKRFKVDAPPPPPTNRLWWMERPRDIFFRFFEYLNDDNTIVFVYIFMKEIEKKSTAVFPSQSTQLCVVFLVSLVRFVCVVGLHER